MGRRKLILCALLVLVLCGAPSAAFAKDGLRADVNALPSDGSADSPAPPICEGVSLTSSGAPVTALHIGESVQVAASISGDATGVVYNYVWSKDGSWDPDSWSSTVKASGAPTSNASWEFVPSTSGSYDLYVDAIFPDGRVATERATLTVKEEWTYSDLTASDASIELGESVELSPVVSGVDSSVARFNYVWQYGDSWSLWSSNIKETGSPTSDSSWLFTPSRAGEYTLYVDAIDTNGVARIKSVKLTVVSSWDASEEGLAVSASAVILGEPLDLGVSLAPGSNPTGLVYNFGWQYGTGWELWDSLLKQGGASAEPSCSLVLPKAGSYCVFADVIGTDGRKETLSRQVEVVLPYEFFGVDVSSPSVTLGGSVEVTPVVSGDVSRASYNYVWSRNGSWEPGEWSSTVRETGSETSEVSWVFEPTRSGDYTLYVDVVAPDGSRQTFWETVEVGSGWEAGAPSATLPSPQKVGSRIEISVPVEGPRSSEVAYNYVWSRNGSWEPGEWSSTVRETGSETSEVSWVFEPTRSGDYTLYVDVVDLLSGEKESMSMPFRVDKTWKLEGLDVSYSSPLRPGSSVTWRPRVSGDTSGLRYNFIWDRNGWDSWNSTLKHSGDYTSASSVTYEISSLSGVFGFYVDVVDANGEVEQAQVTGIRGYSAADNIAMVTAFARGQVGYQGGWKYENALVSEGGNLCNNRHGWWCATYIWWCFYQANLLDIWGTNPLESDPEYLAWQYSNLGAYRNGVYGVKPGDIIFSYWTPWRSGQSITHASYVLSVSSDYITVLEGNISSKVDVHTYRKDWWRWRGYARPAY